MATDKELESKYNELKSARIKIEDSPRNSDGTRTVNGKRISAAEFRNILSDAKDKESKARSEFGLATKKTEKVAKTKSDYVKQLKDDRQGYVNTVAAISNQIEKGYSQFPEIDQKRIDDANAEIARIDSVLTSSTIKPMFDEYGQAVLPKVTATTRGTPAPTTEKPATTTGVQGGRGVSPGATAKEIKAAQKKGKKPKTPKAPGTTTTTPAATEETTTAPAAAPTVDWQTTFRSMFPSQAWLLDLDAAKYPKLRALLEQAAKDRMWETTDGQQRFATQLDGTDFYQELKTNNIVRDIKSTVGDLGFDSTSFNAFITKAMNMGWKGDNLRFETYREAFRTDETTGQYVNPVTVDRIKKSTPWLAVAKIGTDFFSQVSDQDIQKTLTGEMSNDDVLRKQRELAKTKYAHLGSLIDQGFTLDELSTSFKSKAAQMLEVDPTTINMADTKWESAINYGEEGKKRMMTTGEWELLLRTDKQYNWDKTENAKQEARRLADTISQAFGRVL